MDIHECLESHADLSDNDLINIKQQHAYERADNEEHGAAMPAATEFSLKN